jgi:ATP-dependent RNA helicase DHX33
LISGLFANIAELQRDNTYVALSNRQRAKLHPSSVLANGAMPPYIIFTEFVITQKAFLRTVTSIEPDWIGEVMPGCGALEKLNLNRHKMNSHQESTTVGKTFTRFNHL